MDDKEVALYGVEAEHSSALTNGSIGIMQGFKSFMLQSNDGSATLDTKSLASGINFYSCGPEHSYLKSIGRVNYTYATDEDALNAYKLVTKHEKLNPSLEPSHAFAEVIKIAPKLEKDTVCIVNSCGDAKKDRDRNSPPKNAFKHTTTSRY